MTEHPRLTAADLAAAKEPQLLSDLAQRLRLIEERLSRVEQSLSQPNDLGRPDHRMVSEDLVDEERGIERSRIGRGRIRHR